MDANLSFPRAPGLTLDLIEFQHGHITAVLRNSGEKVHHFAYATAQRTDAQIDLAADRRRHAVLWIGNGTAFDLLTETEVAAIRARFPDIRLIDTGADE